MLRVNIFVVTTAIKNASANIFVISTLIIVLLFFLLVPTLSNFLLAVGTVGLVSIIVTMTTAIGRLLLKEQA